MKPGGFRGATVEAGNAQVAWTGAVKLQIAANKKSGQFSGKMSKVVGGKLTAVLVKGSFTCKGVLDAPDQ